MIMKRKILVLLSAAAFLCAARTYAHHSFAATYYVDKTITIEGNLVQFLYRNPHSFVKVEAPDGRTTWKGEWLAFFFCGDSPCVYDTLGNSRGRDGDCSPPPARTRTGAINASGSY